MIKFIGSILLIIFLLVGTLATASLAAPAFDFTWTDGFDDDQLQPRWYWVNEEPSMWSLTAHPGYLRIVTAPVPVYGQNLLLQQAPSGDFEVTTHVLFEPSNNFQIAGLVLNQDEDNLLLFGRAYCGFPPPNCVGNGIYFDHIEGGVNVGGNFATNTTELDHAYLKVVRQGSDYSGYYSEDGADWTFIGTHTVGAAFHLSGVGLGAAQDYDNFQEPADFDFFALSMDYLKVFLPFTTRRD